MDLLGTESFETTFGKKSTRKRPKIAGASDMDALLAKVSQQAEQYQEEKDSNVNQVEDWKFQKESVFGKGTSKRIWGELYKVIDSSDVVIQVSCIGITQEPSCSHAGRATQILDARDPQGTRCRQVEKHMKEHASHKHLVRRIIHLQAGSG